MAQITITIPDAKAILVRDAICSVYGYQDTIDGAANPVTKAQFVQAQLKNFAHNAVIEYRNRQVQATVAAEDNML